MAAFHQYVDEYRHQMQQGAVPAAYRGLMEYMMGLRTGFSSKHPDYIVSGSIYPGYMDMTYFSFFPKSLKARNLKVAVVLIHETVRFEVWLAGFNKPAQAKYWKLFKKSGWDQYPIVPTTQGEDAILAHVLASDPDFSDLDALTARIETGTLQFIADVESFLTGRPD